MGNPINFSVVNVQQIQSGTIRVTYSIQPLMFSQTSTNDSLNIKNYLLTGPGGSQISSANSVSGDPYSIDLRLNSSLALGVWTLSITNVTTAPGVSLTPPFSFKFTALSAS